jgi:hypothetical protein
MKADACQASRPSKLNFQVKLSIRKMSTQTPVPSRPPTFNFKVRLPIRGMSTGPPPVLHASKTQFPSKAFNEENES